MREYPLISVILPVYNIEEYLPKCMESLFAQTYTNLELILIDDGATDKSPELCDKYAKQDSRVKVLHKKNGGLSDARNYGIERANGEYITCVDPDDYVDNDYIEYLFNLIVKYKTNMSICQHRVIKNGTIIHEYGNKGEEEIPNKICIERILYHDVIDTSAWGKLYKTELFSDVKYPFGKQYEDIATTYKLLYKCETVAVGYESKYNYIIRSTSIVNGQFNIKKLDLLDMTDDMAKDVISHYPELENATLRRQVYARFSTLNQMLWTKGYDEEKQTIIDFIKKNQRNVFFNPKAPKRDKFAILVLCGGVNCYKQFWKLVKK